MDKNMAFLYIIMLAISCCLFFYILTKTNFEQLFKKGKVSEIRASYVLASFILGSVFSFFIVKLVEVVTSLILK